MELEKHVTPILVVNNNSLRPYIEAFHYEPENIMQQPLGTLVGYFEIREYSEDSAYIVNFLTSVMKKEYYINAKRPVAESLDAALHKANVALSELAKHGNVNWLGHLDAAICVLEKNNLHFGVAGNGNIMLSRGETFTSISSGLASEESQIHPLKTFVQVASGRIEKDDRILIASNAVFSILPIEELKKNNTRLKEEQFAQFLKTALSNELDLAYATCISIKKTAIAPAPKKPRVIKNDDRTINAFSEKAFEAPKIKDYTVESSEVDIVDIAEESDSHLINELGNKKTGHIYIKGEESEENPENNQWQKNLLIAKEHLSDWSYLIRNNLRRRKNIIKKDLAQFMKELVAKQAEKKLQLQKKRQEEEKLQAEQRELMIAQVENHNPPFIADSTKPTPAAIKDIAPKNSATNQKPQPKNTPNPSEKSPKSITNISREFPLPAEKKPSYFPIVWQQALTIARKIKQLLPFKKISRKQFEKPAALMAIMPSITRIRGAFALLSSRQKILVTTIILSIIILPLLAIKISSNKSNPDQKTSEITSQPSAAEVLANETNIVIHPETKTILGTQTASLVISARQDSFAIVEDKLISLSEDTGKEFAIPQEFGSPIATSYMEDLDLVFLLTDSKKIISFSPATKQFKDNAISLQFDKKPPFIATYLTYLYVPDTANDAIYRYPRAEGGFGEATNWLKNGVSLEQIIDGAIDENIYVMQKDKIIKLFRGAPQDFALQQSSTPVEFGKLFTTLDSKYLYVLDKKNSRVVQYEKASGNITKQYFHESFSGGTSLAVNFSENAAYIATTQGIIELQIK